MCYHTEFGRCALNGVGLNTGKTPNWGAPQLRSLGIGGVANPTRPSLRVTTSNLVILRQRVYA